MKTFTGTGVALITPFDEQHQIDFTALEQLINHCIEGGVEFLVSLGTTGESVTLSTAEQHQVLDFTVKTVNKRVKVVAGFGGNDTTALISTMEQYHFEGIDGILSASPAYNKPSQEGIYQHFMAIAAKAPCPIILYNVPSRTGSNMTAETILRLANASNKFVAIKEASGDLGQCMQIVQGDKPAHFSVLSGDDNLTLPMLALGMDGLISVVANAYPQDYSDMVRAAMKDDFKTARPLHYKYVDLVNLLFADGNPGGIKKVLTLMNIGTQNVRLPLVAPNDATQNALQKKVASL